MFNHTTVHRPLLHSPADYTIATLVGLLLGVGLWVWLSGQVAGLLFGGTWISTSMTEVIGCLVHLPGHLSDPKQAWPDHARSALPGPVGFYFIAALLAAGATAAVTWLVRAATARRGRRGMASRRDLAKTLTARAARARADRLRPELGKRHAADRDVSVDAGRAKPAGIDIAVPIDTSTLILAAPQIGKTSQLTVPWIAQWPGPVVATTVRRTEIELTYQIREALGPVAVLDLTDTPWPHRLSWSPAARAESFDVARKRADLMITIGKGDSEDSQNAGFFGLTGTNLLATWLHAAAIDGREMSDVVTWALNERNNTSAQILGNHPNAAPGIGDMAANIYDAPAETRNNMFTTVMTGVAPLLSQGGRATFCQPHRANIDLDRFIRENGTIYILIDKDEASALAPLISAFVDELLLTARRIADESPSGRLSPPLGMILDEVSNVVPLPQLPSLMSYGAGSGLFVAPILQTLAAARQRWGREGADMIWGAAGVKIALGGLAGEELDKFSALAGTYRERVTTPQYSHRGAHLSTTLTDRKTLSPADVRTLSTSQREALIVHQATPVTKTRLKRHYESSLAPQYRQSQQYVRGLLGADETPSAVQHTSTSLTQALHAPADDMVDEGRLPWQ